MSEKIEAFLGSSYFLHSKEEGSTRVKTHLFFFPLENVRFGILLLHSKSLRELTLRAEEKSRSFVEHSLRRLHVERDFTDDDDDDDDDVEEKRRREKMETTMPSRLKILTTRRRPYRGLWTTVLKIRRNGFVNKWLGLET